MLCSGLIREFDIFSLFCGYHSGQFGNLRQIQIDFWSGKIRLSQFNPIFGGKNNWIEPAQSDYFFLKMGPEQR